MSYHPKAHIMKTHKVLFLALIVSAAFAIPAQAGDRHRSNGDEKIGRSSSTHYSSPGVRYTGGRMFAPSPRMSMRSNTFSQRRTFSAENGPVVTRRFTPRTFSSGNGSGLARFQNSRPIQTNRIGE